MLKVDMEYEKGILYVRLKGVLDRKVCYKINNYVVPVVLKHKVKYLVFNLYELEGIDESGMDALLNVKCAIRTNKGKICLCEVSDFFHIFAIVLTFNFYGRKACPALITISQCFMAIDRRHILAFGKIDTPFYFYDMDLFRRTVSGLASLSSRYGIKVHYAVKANTEERLLRHISSYGFGADCVSGNEVEYAVSCGFRPENTVFAGVGKSDREILSSLKLGIGTFNCESLQEIEVVDSLAASLGLTANVSVRINPDIDAHTHKYVTTGLYENKFGISRHEFEPLVELLGRCGSIRLHGLHFHIGSQITDVAEVYGLECRRASEIVRWFENKGLVIANIDLGGGLGVDYDDPDGNPVADFSTWFRTISSELPLRPGQTVHVEPGRSVVAQCGTLVSRVLFVKSGETKTMAHIIR